MPRLNLSPPGVVYYRQLSALFENDSEILVVLDDDEGNKIINIYVDGNERKIEGLSRILPESKTFGNVELKINIIPSNSTKSFRNEFSTLGELYYEVFVGNKAFVDVIETPETYMGGITYVIFKKEVVQYFEDNLCDINGICSTLYQDIARNVLETPAKVYYCTDK